MQSKRKFLQHHRLLNESPFPVFYLTVKVHKTPLKTRPIVSCSGSLLYGLGVWLDDKLQKVAQQQKSYFKSSFDLKTDLVALQLPPDARLFSADAIAMYTNIPTARALREIAQYLRTQGHQYCSVSTNAIIDALRLIMTNNIFTFGDTCWKQISGTAMGTPPAPPYATLYYAIHEELLLEEFGDNLLLYKRFIDDVLGIWVVTDPTTDTARWNSFQSRMNEYHGLVWEHSARCTKLDFMDLTLSIKNQRIHTTLFEKSLNLYLYIPPHSGHPPGSFPAW